MIYINDIFSTIDGQTNSYAINVTIKLIGSECQREAVMAELNKVG